VDNKSVLKINEFNHQLLRTTLIFIDTALFFLELVTPYLLHPPLFILSVILLG